MKENRVFIDTVFMEEIPWHRLTTPYGSAADFPKLFEDLKSSDLKIINHAGIVIAQNIEHQSTLWHCTPFAMIFLTRIFIHLADMENTEGKIFLVKNLLELFVLIAECVDDGDRMEHAPPLAFFTDILKEEYLCTGTEEEDCWEDDMYPDDLFYSFYFYSREVLRHYKEGIFKVTSTVPYDEIHEKALELQRLI